ncbi:hypothetical protein JCM1841_000329 [Sporobolomyces salmonicolor]
MAHRSAADLQSRYSQHFSGRASTSSLSSPPPATPLSATHPNHPYSHPHSYHPVSQPSLPPLAHSRYSSADFYALQTPPGETPAASASPSASSGLLHHPHLPRHDLDSDSDDDDGAGFGTYKDFGAVSRQSMATAPKSGSARISQAPTLVSNPTGTSIFHTLDKLKLDTVETVNPPLLAKQDWRAGEGLREKDIHKAEKAIRKREEMREIAGEYVDKFRSRWKTLVPLILLSTVTLIVVLYFCIPRVPTITFINPKVPHPAFNSTDLAPFISGADPISFSFDATLSFAIDASASYVPVKYKEFGITVRLQETQGVIATESWKGGAISVPGRKVTSYEFPIVFSGNYSSAYDPTFQIMQSACAHVYPTTYRPPLNLTMEISSNIIGVVNAPNRTASLHTVDCPIQWPSDAS